MSKLRVAVDVGYSENPELATPVTVEHATDPQQSFETFYRASYVDMVRFARLLVGSTPTAEDLVQDSFVAVQRRWDRIEDPLAYTRRVVANTVRSHHRRRFLERRHDRPIREPTVELHAGELDDVLAQLPLRQRQAVVMRFYLGLTERETAAAIGCRPGTVGSLLHRALATLRIALEEETRP